MLNLEKETPARAYYTAPSTDTRRTYQVTVDRKTGLVNCTCVHGSVFRFGRFGGVCWHIKKALEDYDKRHPEVTQ